MDNSQFPFIHSVRFMEICSGRRNRNDPVQTINVGDRFRAALDNVSYVAQRRNVLFASNWSQQATHRETICVNKVWGHFANERSQSGTDLLLRKPVACQPL